MRASVTAGKGPKPVSCFLVILGALLLVVQVVLLRSEHASPLRGGPGSLAATGDAVAPTARVVLQDSAVAAPGAPRAAAAAAATAKSRAATATLPLPPATRAQPAAAADPWAGTRALQGGARAASAAGAVRPAAPPPAGLPLPSAALPSVAAVSMPQAPADAAAGLSGAKHVDYFCVNRARSEAEEAAVDGKSMTDYIGTGGRFPILVITCDRAEQLARTLKALLAVRCVERKDILVVADECEGVGAAELPAIAASAGVAFHRKSQDEGSGEPPRTAAPPTDGAARIAGAYKYALSFAFTAFPRAPGIVIVEDDMAFSPDFFEYFHAVAPLLEADPSLWLASAWSDNGFDYLISDARALKRTRYFPGLGWLLPRMLWQGQLAATWPVAHWDHWLRDPGQHRGRDVLHPEVPRDYHMGVSGTFMDTGTHNKYFGSIAMADDARFSWDTPAGAAAIEAASLHAYEGRVKRALSAPSTVQLTTVGDIASFDRGEGVVWYSCPVGEQDHASYRPFAAFFGIWHEGARGSRAGIHELAWRGTAKLWLVNVFEGYIPPTPVSGEVEAAPSWVRILQPKGGQGSAAHRPILCSAFIGAARPALMRRTSAGGVRVSSPLAHLAGGEDANGAPDVGEGEGGEGGGGDGEDVEHAHLRFGADLRLSKEGA